MARRAGQHHRHAGTRRLHGRGGTFFESVGRSNRGVLRRRRRGTPERDGLEAGQPLQRAPGGVHQQDGQGRGPLRRGRAGDARQARGECGAHPDAHRQGGGFLRAGGPGPHEGADLGRRCPGRAVPRSRDPRRARRGGPRGPRAPGGEAGGDRRRADGGVRRRHGDRGRGGAQRPSARQRCRGRSSPSSAGRPSRTRASRASWTRSWTTSRRRRMSRRLRGRCPALGTTSSGRPRTASRSRRWPSRS